MIRGDSCVTFKKKTSGRRPDEHVISGTAVGHKRTCYVKETWRPCEHSTLYPAD